LATKLLGEQFNGQVPKSFIFNKPVDLGAKFAPVARRVCESLQEGDPPLCPLDGRLLDR